MPLGKGRLAVCAPWVATLALVLALPASAQAVRPVGSPAPPPAALPSPPSASTPTAPTTQSPSPDTGGGILGSPDVTQALGGTDASCHHLAGASAEVVRDCDASGLAESPWPPGNYATDTHVDTGITSWGNDLAAIGQEVIGGVYGLVAHVLTWVLLGLGLAFGFDLFASDKHGQIAYGIHNALTAFTYPLLPAILIVGALIGIVHWWGHRSEGKAVGHWALMAFLLCFGLLIALNPVGVLGWFDRAANTTASGSLAAFTGSGGGAADGFANATPGMYRNLMEKPWCSMEFGNVDWCMARVDPAMARARQSVLAHLPDALGDQGDPQLAKQQAPIERVRLLDARTNGELFLAFPPNADARNGKNDSWTLYSALLKDRPDLAAIRGPGGVWQRLAVLVLSGVAGLFFLVLLVYVAWQLIVASVVFVLCLLLSPVALLTPAFGEGGRGVFFAWLAWMIESLLKRVIFAVYLGIILLVTSVFFAVGPSLGGWLIQWLILAGIWAMAFAFRHRILGLMTGGAYVRHGSPQLAQAARYGAKSYAWKRIPQRVAVTEEHVYEGDTTHQHAHVHFGDAAPRPEPRRTPVYAGEVVDGTARELDP